MDEQNRKAAEEVVKNIKALVKKGNIARVLVKRGDGETLLNIPLNVGVAGTILGAAAAPWALITAAVASMGLNCTVELVKTNGETVEVLSRDKGKRAVDLGVSVFNSFKKS